MRGSLHRTFFPVACLALALLPVCLDGCTSVAVPTASPPANTQPGIGGNQRPSFTFLAPDRTVSISIGDVFLISWIDSDPDNSATIDLLLDPDTNNNSGNELIILAGRQEDSDLFADDSFEFDTTAVPVGNYILRALINDNVNPEVIVEAPGILNIVPVGTAPLNSPPKILFTQPAVNRSVANGDPLLIQWEDTDSDDNALVILTLDFDALIPSRPLMCPMSMTALGELTRSFIAGSKLCPPERSFASLFFRRSEMASFRFLGR